MITTADQLRRVIQQRKVDSGQDMPGRVYQFIVKYKTAHNGNSPSFRQIKDELGISTTSLVNEYIKALVRQGKVRQEEGSRGIIVVGSEWRLK